MDTLRMTAAELINSGILEAWILGAASPADEKLVAEWSADPEVAG